VICAAKCPKNRVRYTSYHGSTPRPWGHPTAFVSPHFLDKISFPNVGYSWGYSFSYFDGNAYPAPASTLASGALKSQTLPTGATISYEYGTWTFFHANLQNRPGTCAPPSPTLYGSSPINRTGPGVEPTLLPDIGACYSPDRVAGIVRRTIDVGNSVTDYWQYSFPKGESGQDASAQTETLVVSPLDAQSHRHSTSYLFSASSSAYASGPLVGASVRTAVFNGDASGGQYGYGYYSNPGPVCSNALFCVANSTTRRVVTHTHETDAFDATAIFPVEANRRIKQNVTAFNPLISGQPASGKYHRADYVFDAIAGAYSKQTDSGTIGGDARETETARTPLIDTTHWKLDVPHFQYLRATAGGVNFSTVANGFDSYGYPTSSTISDPTNGTLQRSTPRDAHGFPSSETVTHAGTSYTKTFTFAAGTLKTSSWGSLSWKSVDNDIDSTTGLVVASYDPNRPYNSQLKSTFTYDVFGRPLVTTPPNSEAPTTTTYDSPTQVTTKTALPGGGGTEMAWSRTIVDGLGRVIKQQRKMSGGSIVKKIARYDPQGNKVFESEWAADAAYEGTLPGTAWSDFDEFGRTKTITKTDGKTTTIDYSDTTSNPASVWLKTVTINDMPTAGQSSTTKYLSDAFGRLIKVTEPINSDETSYTYDVQGSLTGVTQGQQTRSFTYDAFGFLRSESTPEIWPNSITYSQYDPLGNVLLETRPTSVNITRAFDTAGRLRTVTVGGLTYIENCYDGNGTCTGAPNFAGGTYPYGKLTRRRGQNYDASNYATGLVTEDFTYSEAIGRLSSKATAITGIAGAIPATTERWYYDKFGQVTNYYHPRSVGSFMEATTFDYGLPTAITANGIPVLVGATYRPSGTLGTYTTGTNTGHNVTTTIAEDTTGMPRPRQISTSGASANFDTGVYSYDGAGNITAIGLDSFTSDKESRLTQAAFSGLGSQSFVYDRYGNLTTKGTSTYTVSMSTNRISGYFSGGQSGSVTYDQRGNVQTNTLGTATETYTSDALDRYTRYQVTGGIDWKYLYDGASERLGKIPTSGTDYFFTLRDPAKKVVTEYLGTSVSRDNIFFGSLLIGSYSSCALNGQPGWQLYSSDHLGTPRLITDMAGTTLDTRKYWPFGEEATGSTTSPQRLRFAGMERDAEANRYYAHARSHDFSLARFLSPDVVFGHPAAPQSWNRYGYSLGNPLRFTDTSGLSPGDGFDSEGNDQSEEGREERDGRPRLDARYTAPDSLDVTGLAASTSVTVTAEDPFSPFAHAVMAGIASTDRGVTAIAEYTIGVSGLAGVGVVALDLLSVPTLTLGLSGGTLTSASGTVYVIMKDGVVRYVGQTRDLVARTAAHFRRWGIPLRELENLGGLSLYERKGVEQVLIEKYGPLATKVGPLWNLINSISDKNPIYPGATERGRELLRAAGYSGF
jgi:RHS repeat-associated protein